MNAVVELCRSTDEAVAAETRCIVQTNLPLLSAVLQQHGADVDVFLAVTTLLAVAYRRSGVGCATPSPACAEPDYTLVHSVYDTALHVAPVLRDVSAFLACQLKRT